jgi:hypothetical protein
VAYRDTSLRSANVRRLAFTRTTTTLEHRISGTIPGRVWVVREKRCPTCPSGKQTLIFITSTGTTGTVYNAAVLWI